MGTESEAAAGRLADHLKDCRGVDAVIAHDGNADGLVAQLIEAGWKYEGVEYVEGKRVRYFQPPPGWIPGEGTASAEARAG